MMILGQAPRAPFSVGSDPVRPLFYQVVGSDPEFRKRCTRRLTHFCKMRSYFCALPKHREWTTALPSNGPASIYWRGSSALLASVYDNVRRHFLRLCFKA